MQKLTEKNILKEVLKYDGADDNAIKTALGLFKSSNQNLQDFLLEMDNTSCWNTGGGCLVSVLKLDNKELFIVNDECGIIYKDEDSFWDYDKGSEVMGWYIEENK